MPMRSQVNPVAGLPDFPCTGQKSYRLHREPVAAQDSVNRFSSFDDYLAEVARRNALAEENSTGLKPVGMLSVQGILLSSR